MIKTAICSKLPALRWIELLVVIATVVIYGWVSYQRNTVWKDDVSLWLDVVKKSPEKARPHNNLGVSYTEKSLIEKAIVEIKEALRLKPDFINAYISLGNTYMKNGLIETAITQYSEALRIKPDYGEAYVNLGNAYINKDLLDQAIVYYKKSISLTPGYVPAHVNLASAYGLKGLVEDAIAEYKIALGIESDNPDIHFNLGLAYEQLAKSKEQSASGGTESKELIVKAIKHYNEAIRINSNDAQAREKIEKLRAD